MLFVTNTDEIIPYYEYNIILQFRPECRWSHKGPFGVMA